jgi:hypothetical protein
VSSSVGPKYRRVYSFRIDSESDKFLALESRNIIIIVERAKSLGMKEVYLKYPTEHWLNICMYGALYKYKQDKLQTDYIFVKVYAFYDEAVAIYSGL